MITIKKKTLFLGATVLLLMALVYYINDQRKYTTFEDALSEWISTEENIVKIAFTDNRGSVGNKKTVVLEAQGEINELFDSTNFQSALEMEIKEGNKPLPTTNYHVDLYTDKEPYTDAVVSIVYGEKDLLIGDRYYIIPESEYNHLVRIIADYTS